MFGFSLIAIMACNGTDKTQTGHQWQLIESQIGPGMLLSGWSTTEEVLMVGGGMYGQGDGVLVRYHPGENRYCWKTVTTGHALWWIHGNDDDNWWAVGDNGTVLHQENGSIVEEDIGTDLDLYGVFVDNETVWAVGGNVDERTGGIFRRIQGEWQTLANDLPGVVFKVYDGFFVGDQVAYQWNAETEELIDLNNDERLITIRGSSTDNMWAVGGQANAVVRQWNGTEWIDQNTTGLNLPLNGIWTGPNETVWVAGMSGTQGFLDEDGTWSTPELPLTADHFHAVWKHNDETLFIGGNFLSTSPPYHGTVVRYGPVKEQPIVEQCND